MRFLIVDDHSTMRRIVRNILNELGYEKTYEADDGPEALVILNEEPIDFVITDWNMPKMKGIDLLKKIRSREKIKHVPVLIVTAESTKEQVLESIQAGVNGYLVKPFTAATLETKINCALGIKN